MKLFYLTISIVCLLFFGCSKSSDSTPDPIPVNPNPSVLDIIEDSLNVKIPGKEKLTFITAMDGVDLLTLNVTKDGEPVAFVIDKAKEAIISTFTFSQEIKAINLHYGESAQVVHSFLKIYRKSDTHLYGVILYKDPEGELNTYSELFVAEIKNSKIVETLVYPSKILVNVPFSFFKWYDNTLLITTTDTYRIVGAKNKTLFEGKHSNLNVIRSGTPVSMTKTIKFDAESRFGEILIYDILTNNRYFRGYDVKENNDDRVEVVSIKSDGKIATIILEITTYEGEKSEKTVKVDFVDYKIVE